ncbi:MAG: hypothetical protein E6G23_06690, partial [Actinobacteria bacterium]
MCDLFVPIVRRSGPRLGGRGAAGASQARRRRNERATSALLRSPGPRSGRFYVMPNIKQQKKRVRTATRERLENLRYRSTVKT